MTEPSIVDLALQDPPAHEGPLLSGFFAGLAERVESALLSPQRETLVELCDAVARLTDFHLNGASPSLSGSLGAESVPDLTKEINEALILGRLAFAQALLTQAVQKRVPGDVGALIKAQPYAPYMRALVEGERTNAELRDRYGEAAETVSRKLRILRDSGVTDFRKEGRRIVNFLTPTALAFIQAEASAERPPGAPAAVVGTAEPIDSARAAGDIAKAALKKKLTPEFSEQPIIEGADHNQRAYGHG